MRDTRGCGRARNMMDRACLWMLDKDGTDRMQPVLKDTI